MSSTLDAFRRSLKGKKKPEPNAKKKLNLVMSPLEFLAREVAIRRKGAPETIQNVTGGVVGELRYAVKHNANVTCMVIGKPGKGKSKFAFLLGKMYIMLTSGLFEYCWDIDEIPYVPDGGWLHIDEWLIPEGEGRNIALQRIKNRFDTCRAKQISISVSTPTAPELPFVSFEATAIAQDFDNRMNLFEIRVPLPRYGMVYIGNALVPLGKSDERWNKYEAESKARKDRVWEEDGAKTIKKMDTKAAAQEVLEWVKEKGYLITTKTMAATFAKAVEKENEWRKKKWEINYYTGPDIVNWIMILYEGATSQKEYSGQVKDLREALYTRLEECGVKKRHVKMLKSYVKGNIQTEVAIEFGVNTDAVSKAIGSKSRLRLVILGTSFEDVWAAKLRAEGKTVKQGGGNTPEPDILILDKDGKIVEVQSLKCQITKSTTTTLYGTDIAASEEALRKKGIPLNLVYFDVVTDKVHVVEVDGRAKYKFTRKV